MFVIYMYIIQRYSQSNVKLMQGSTLKCCMFVVVFVENIERLKKKVYSGLTPEIPNKYH